MNLDIDGDEVAESAGDAVGAGEHTAVDGAVAAGYDHPWPGHRLDSLLERDRHVLGNHPSHEHPVGVAR